MDQRSAQSFFLRAWPWLLFAAVVSLLFALPRATNPTVVRLQQSIQEALESIPVWMQDPE